MESPPNDWNYNNETWQSSCKFKLLHFIEFQAEIQIQCQSTGGQSHRLELFPANIGGEAGTGSQSTIHSCSEVKYLTKNKYNTNPKLKKFK